MGLFAHTRYPISSLDTLLVVDAIEANGPAIDILRTGNLDVLGTVKSIRRGTVCRSDAIMRITIISTATVDAESASVIGGKALWDMLIS